jgi:hypothetical protein
MKKALDRKEPDEGAAIRRPPKALQGEYIMGNRYLQEVTEIVRKQQGKRGPVWMCGGDHWEWRGLPEAPEGNV